MHGDPYRQIRGVREPDPTLGKNLRRPTPAEPAAPPSRGKIESVPRGKIEPVPPGPPLEPPEPEPAPPKIRRTKVVLSGPRSPSNALRARVELEEQNSWGELLIKDLVKAQLRTGVLLSVLVVVLLGALPVTFFLSPTFAGLRVVGVPVAWLLLGVAPFPLLLAVGLWYNRLAERHERAFVDMIEN